MSRMVRIVTIATLVVSFESLSAVAAAADDSLGPPPLEDVLGALEGAPSEHFRGGWEPVAVVEYEIVAVGPQLTAGLLPNAGGAAVRIWGDPGGAELMDAFRGGRSWSAPDAGTRHLLVVAVRESPPGRDVVWVDVSSFAFDDAMRSRLTAVLGPSEVRSAGFWERTRAVATAWMSAVGVAAMLLAVVLAVWVTIRRRRQAPGPRKRMFVTS